MIGVLFDLNIWEFTKGVVNYTIPGLWLMIKMLWPVLLILIVTKLFLLFIERRLPVLIEQIKDKFRR